MNFIDEAFLEIRAGNGGAGASSFRREKYIPFGGPDGGDGGKGGDVVFRVNLNKNTLIDFQNKRVFIAKNGRPGSGKNKSGSAADNLVIDIPKGTVIYSSDLEKIYHRMHHGFTLTNPNRFNDDGIKTSCLA